jgi:hypothetical protein
VAGAEDRAVRAALVLILGFALAGCHSDPKPRPLHLDGKLVDGTALSTATLHGHPSVVALWMPG